MQVLCLVEAGQKEQDPNQDQIFAHATFTQFSNAPLLALAQHDASTTMHATEQYAHSVVQELKDLSQQVMQSRQKLVEKQQAIEQLKSQLASTVV